jgi:monoamine oxidase
MVSRRACLRFLGSLPLVLTACGGEGGSDSSDESAVTAGRDLDVVVIGAGIAGIRAAQVLTEAGKKVVVLEARDRIGGRVFTDRAGFGMPIELGASWIHDSKENPITTVAKAAGVKTAKSDYSERVWRAGVLIEESTSNAASKAFRAQLDRATKGSKPTESMRDAVERTLGGSLALADREAVEWQIAANIEYALGADAELVSASRFNDGEDLEEDNLIVKGYDLVAAAIGKSVKVRTGETVRRIDRSAPGRVAVHSTSGVFFAKQVVVTLSVGVLQAGKVEFSPPLSAKKKEILGRLGMGVLSKTFLRFPRVFWPTPSDFLGRIPPLAERGQWGEWLNVAKFMDAPILAALNGGKHARAIEAASEQDIVRDAMAALRTMFPDAPDPIGILQTRWSQDPLALGSYSFLPVGARAGDRAGLGEPEGPIFFAGEACSADHAQTVHGAYLSGEASAKAILAG